MSASPEICKALQELENVSHIEALNTNHYKILTEKFLEVVCSKEFLELSVNAVTRLLNNEFLGIDNETDVLRAAFRWIHADKENRLKMSNDVLSCVRMVYIDAEDVFATLQGKEYISFSPYCSQHFYKALWYRTLKEHNQLDKLYFDVPKPRKSTLAEMSKHCLVCMKKTPGSFIAPAKQYILSLGGVNSSKKADIDLKKNCYSYNPIANSWSKFNHDLPYPMSHHGACIMENVIYIAGGLGSDNKTTDSAFKFHHQKWSKIANMNKGRSDFQLVAFQKKVYAIGGCDSEANQMDSVEVYDPRTNEWQEISGIPEGTMALSSCVHNNLIWISGGIVKTDKVDKAKMTKNVEVFDPTHKKWFHRSKLINARSHHVMISAGKLFVIGGAALMKQNIVSLNSVEYFNEESRAWETFGTLRIPRLRFGACAIEKKVYIVGGYNSQNDMEIENCEILDLESIKSTSLMEPMPLAILGNMCLTVGAKLLE